MFSVDRHVGSLRSCTENLTETDAFIRSSLALDLAEEYKMDNKQRGLALIFNQEHFFLSRCGTEADRDNLEKRLIKLKFEVRAYDDVEKKDVEDRNTEGSVVKDSKTATDRAPLDPAEEYKMDNKRRGLALIFNQEHFIKSNTRRGTKADRDNLEKRLKELKFEVRAYDDLKKKDVEDRIKEAAEADHSDADCFLLVFLSHGNKDHVSTYDDMISIEDITSPFKGDKCRSLVGKPKIFIFQACRGDKPDDPVTARDAEDSVSETNEEVVETGGVDTLPAGADFIMCYSVAEGYFSFRNSVNGSWYIQDLCELLQEYGNSLEFAELLTLVNRKVSMRSVKSDDPKMSGKKQIPCFASMLTKKLYFRQKQ